jgi:hypothetical protein
MRIKNQLCILINGVLVSILIRNRVEFLVCILYYDVQK